MSPRDRKATRTPCPRCEASKSRREQHRLAWRRSQRRRQEASVRTRAAAPAVRRPIARTASAS